jgi:hypothetical protein
MDGTNTSTIFMENSAGAMKEIATVDSKADSSIRVSCGLCEATPSNVSILPCKLLKADDIVLGTLIGTILAKGEGGTMPAAKVEIAL